MGQVLGHLGSMSSMGTPIGCVGHMALSSTHRISVFSSGIVMTMSVSFLS